MTKTTKEIKRESDNECIANDNMENRKKNKCTLVH